MREELRIIPANIFSVIGNGVVTMLQKNRKLSGDEHLFVFLNCFFTGISFGISRADLQKPFDFILF